MRRFFQKINSLSPNLTGALWMLGSVVCFLSSNMAVKLAGEQLPSVQIVFLRVCLQALILLPLMAKAGFSAMKTRQIKNYALRLTFGVTNIVLMFYAFTHLPFATATSLFFSRPLFTIPLAAFLIGERAGWRRGIATLAGFAGILIVLNPGPVGLSSAEMAALSGAFCMSVTYFYIQKLSRTENHTAMMMWFALTAAAVTFGPALYVWQPFGLKTSGVICLIALAATAAQYCVIRAYQVGKVTVISPLEYLQIPLSALLGFVFFSEQATLNFAAGSVVVVAASLYILRKKPED